MTGLKQTLFTGWPVSLMVVLHLVLALGTGLSPDEAHYALYAYHLDWSYYDHPPMVGWLQWPAVRWLPGDLGIRLLPMAVWLLSLASLSQLVNALFPQLATTRIWRTRPDVLLFALSPMLFLLGLAWVPDTLLMALACRIMLLTWRLAKLTPNSGAAWCELGLWVGVAGLTKYTAVVLVLGVVLAMCQAQGMAWLKRPWPWLAAGIAAVCIAPVIFWNVQHDWSSIRYQFDHANGSSNWRADRVITYFLTLVLAYGLGLVWWVWKGLLDKSSLKPGELSARGLCLYFGLPGLAMFLYFAGGGRTLPHWPATAVIALLPLAAVGCLRLLDQNRKAVQVLLASHLLLITLASGLMLSAGLGQHSADASSRPAANPFADLHGWQQAAERAERLAQREGANTLAVMNWSLASRIAWYARPLSVKVVNSRQDQFDLWFGPIKDSDKVILVNWSLMKFVPPTGPGQFQQCTALESLPVSRWGRQIAHFDYLLCDGWPGEPARPAS